MKTIGLIGGMSWHSTVEYYRLINEEVQKRLGKHHSAKINIVSVDFETIMEPWLKEDYEKVQSTIIDAGKSLQKSGADFFLLCTNSVHKLADSIIESVPIPFIHIADVTGAQIKSDGIQTIGLLGTKFTMEDDFFSARIARQGVKTVIPIKEDRDILHKIIFDELVKGHVTDSAIKECNRIIESLSQNGTQGIILGCTELPLLFPENRTIFPLYDTTKIHALSAVGFAFGEK